MANALPTDRLFASSFPPAIDLAGRLEDLELATNDVDENTVAIEGLRLGCRVDAAIDLVQEAKIAYDAAVKLLAELAANEMDVEIAKAEAEDTADEADRARQTAVSA